MSDFPSSSTILKKRTKEAGASFQGLKPEDSAGLLIHLFLLALP
jgi:hypothetical protein